MRNFARAMAGSPVARTVVALVVVVPISIYLGTSAVRRGVLYHLEVFAPSVVLGIGVGIWTWSWKWFWYAIATGAALTGLALLLALVAGR
jgi:hypothetical protein